MIYTLGLMNIPYMKPIMYYYQYAGLYYAFAALLCVLLLGIGLPGVIVLGVDRYHRRLENNTNTN